VLDGTNQANRWTRAIFQGKPRPESDRFIQAHSFLAFVEAPSVAYPFPGTLQVSGAPRHFRGDVCHQTLEGKEKPMFARVLEMSGQKPGKGV
jgi:hypothetical protein